MFYSQGNTSQVFTPPSFPVDNNRELKLSWQRARGQCLVKINLSPGQTDSQYSQVATRTSWTCVESCFGWPNGHWGKFPHKSQKAISGQTFPVFHWLIIGKWTSLNLHWLSLGGQTVKNLLWLACKFDFDQSERKPSQVSASACKAWSNPGFRLASPCDSVWPGLYILPSNFAILFFFLDLFSAPIGFRTHSS